MSLIVDASVVVNIFLDEPGSARSEACLARTGVAAPDLMRIEVFHAVWKRVRRGEATREQLAAIDRMVATAGFEFVASNELIDGAVALSRLLDHPIYDTLYLALAARERAPLVTWDARLIAAGRRAGIDCREP